VKIPTEAEIVRYLRDNQPLLSFNNIDNEISGHLIFKVLYIPSTRQRIQNPNADKRSKYYIEDAYEIKIELNTAKNSTLPKVIETGNRISGVQKTYQIKTLADLHVNPDKTVCLFTRPTELKILEENISLFEYIDTYIIDFFYAQSYFEKYQEWPWGEFSHGTMGIFEDYLEEAGSKKTWQIYMKALEERHDWEKYKNLAVNKKKTVRGHTKCPCQSGRKFRECHPLALDGLRKILKDKTLYQ